LKVTNDAAVLKSMINETCQSIEVGASTIASIPYRFLRKILFYFHFLFLAERTPSRVPTLPLPLSSTMRSTTASRLR